MLRLQCRYKLLKLSLLKQHFKSSKITTNKKMKRLNDLISIYLFKFIILIKIIASARLTQKFFSISSSLSYFCIPYISTSTSFSYTLYLSFFLTILPNYLSHPAFLILSSELSFCKSLPSKIHQEGMFLNVLVFFMMITSRTQVHFLKTRIGIRFHIHSLIKLSRF